MPRARSIHHVNSAEEAGSHDAPLNPSDKLAAGGSARPAQPASSGPPARAADQLAPFAAGAASDARTQVALDRARHAVPQLYELLRARIVALDLPPGAALSRAELAQAYGVSQTPVREALLKLAEEQLVDVFPQSATRVSRIDLAHARETHFLRRAIELELVRELALRASPCLLAQLRGIVANQRALHEQDDDRFTEEDQAFHLCLYQAAGKEGLWALVKARSGHIDRLRRLHLPAAGKRERIVSDHAAVLAAIEAGDAEGAQAALRQHLSGTLEYADTIRQAHPAFFSDCMP